MGNFVVFMVMQFVVSYLTINNVAFTKVIQIILKIRKLNLLIRLERRNRKPENGFGNRRAKNKANGILYFENILKMEDIINGIQY